MPVWWCLATTCRSLKIFTCVSRIRYLRASAPASVRVHITPKSGRGWWREREPDEHSKAGILDLVRGSRVDWRRISHLRPSPLWLHLDRWRAYLHSRPGAVRNRSRDHLDRPLDLHA